MIKIAEKGQTTRQFAKEVHILLKDIGFILGKYKGENDEPNYQNNNMSINLKAFAMLNEGYSPLDV